MLRSKYIFIDARPYFRTLEETKKASELTHLLNVSDHTVYILMLQENWSIECINSFIASIGLNKEHKHVTLVVDSLCYDFKGYEINFSNIISYTSMLMKTAIWEESKPEMFSRSWNKDAEKFLFLMGKPFKHNRIRLLYKLYKRDLLKHCEWSMTATDTIKEISREVLDDIPYFEYDKFFNNCVRKLDNIDIFLEQGYHYSGFPFDKSVFSNTLFSLIAESTVASAEPCWVSEKTWRTFANRHPFVMSNSPGSLCFLRGLGFRTFEYFIPHFAYNMNLNVEGGLEDVADSCGEFLKSIPNHTLEIEKMVEDNYQNYRRLVIENRQRIDKKFEPYLLNNKAQTPLPGDIYYDKFIFLDESAMPVTGI